VPLRSRQKKTPKEFSFSFVPFEFPNEADIQTTHFVFSFFDFNYN